MTRKKISVTVVMLMTILGGGCASEPTRFPLCSRHGFSDCLQVDAKTCDAWFADAQAQCQQSQQENTLYESMPDTIREGNMNRCMVNRVVERSGLPEDKTKDCLGQ